MTNRNQAKKIAEALDENNMLRSDKKEATEVILKCLLSKAIETTHQDVVEDNGNTSTTKIELSHELVGDLSGIVYLKGVAIQSFVYESDKFIFKKIAQTGEFEVVKAQFNADKTIDLYWNANPGKNRIVIDYKCLKVNE